MSSAATLKSLDLPSGKLYHMGMVVKEISHHLKFLQKDLPLVFLIASFDVFVLNNFFFLTAYRERQMAQYVV